MKTISFFCLGFCQDVSDLKVLVNSCRGACGCLGQIKVPSVRGIQGHYRNLTADVSGFSSEGRNADIDPLILSVLSTRSDPPSSSPQVLPR